MGTPPTVGWPLGCALQLTVHEGTCGAQCLAAQVGPLHPYSHTLCHCQFRRLLPSDQAVVWQGKLAASPWPHLWYRVVLLGPTWLHQQKT